MACPRCNSAAHKLNGGGRAECKNCGRYYKAPATKAKQEREAKHFTAEIPADDLPTFDELLARRAKQTRARLKADRARELIDVKLVALVEGNHDCWVHGVGGHSPLSWIQSHAGTVTQAHGVRLRITTDDKQTVTINARHDFPGRSQYNAAHGPNKSLLFGCRDDVAVAGHTHVYGRSVMLNPETRTPMHAVRLGSYKHSDEYAHALGLLDNNVTECAVLMVDPGESDPRHRTWIEDNPFRAARVLAQLRSGRKRAA